MLAPLVNALGRRVKDRAGNTAFWLAGHVLRALGQRHLVVRLDTSWQCNLRCRTCHFSDPGLETLPGMDLELFERIAQDLFPRALVLALSCGAEPYMTRGFSDYLSIAARFRVPQLGLVTNGLLLTEARVEELVDARVTELTISMDGATASTYESIRVNGNFFKLIEKLALIDAVKRRRHVTHPALRVNFVVTRENVHELEQLVEVLSPFQPEKIQLRHVGINEGMALDWNDQSARGLQDTFDAHLARFEAAARTRGIRTDAPASFAEQRRRPPRRPPRRPSCINPWMMVYVHPDGSFRPCLYHGHDTFPSFRTHTYDEMVRAMADVKRRLWSSPERSCLELCAPKRGRTHSVTTEGLVALERESS